MKTCFPKSKITVLVLLLRMMASRSYVLNEFETESEFDDVAETERYLAAQTDAVAEWSLPKTNQRKSTDVWKHKKHPKEVYTHQNTSENNEFKKNGVGQRLLHAVRQIVYSSTNTHDNIKTAKICPEFPHFSSPSSFTTCSSVPTAEGVVNWCRITCKPGYRLQYPLLQYEICGKATKYRWTFQLMGLNQASNRCVVGSTHTTFEPCTTPECFETAAYYLNKIDYSLDPCDSFFEFACGRWVKEWPVPGFRGFYDEYSSIRDRVTSIVADLLADPISADDSDSVVKAKTFYESCMDSELINKLDSKPLLELLQNELAWPIIDLSWRESDFDFESTVASLRGKFNNKIMLDFSVKKHMGVYVLESLKGKIPLSAHLYNKGRNEELRRHYSLIKDIALMLGANHTVADIDVRNMKAFEKQFSEIKLRKVHKGGHGHYRPERFQKLTIKKMNHRLPEVDWLVLLNKMIQTSPIRESTLVLMWDEEYLKALINLIKKSSKRTVQNFMIWTLVKHRIENIGDPFLIRLFAHEISVKGIQRLPERKRKCIDELIVTMEGPTGKLFIEAHFSQAKKDAAVELFKYIRKGFIQLLKTEVTWMDKKTKAYAKRKALAIRSEIGYNPRIYENTTYLDQQTQKLEIKREDYFGNFIRLLELYTQNQFSKLGQSYSRHDPFNFRPTMVNALYAATFNLIALPCGEMQYPLYWGESYPRVFQFGAIGTILGHELTHGFDNSGRKFDLNGELENWWSPSSLKEFNKRVKCIEDQYSNYFWKVANEFLDGAKTLSENIADNGGIRESHEGYRLWLKAKNMMSEQLEPATGFTNDQMFFIGYANARCAKYTHKAAKHYLTISSHSPGRYRIDGPLQNFEKFSEAFDCPLGSNMNPKKKCVIW